MTNENGTHDHDMGSDSGTGSEDDEILEGSHGGSHGTGSGPVSHPGSRPVSSGGSQVLPGGKSLRASANTEAPKGDLSGGKHLHWDIYDDADVKEEIIPGIPGRFLRLNPKPKPTLDSR